MLREDLQARTRYYPARLAIALLPRPRTIASSASSSWEVFLAWAATSGSRSQKILRLH